MAKIQCVGSFGSFGGAVEFSGNLYRVKGQDVCLCRDGTLRDPHDGTIIVDERIARAVAAKVAADERENARREALAQAYGGSDERMVEVFRRALRFVDGDEDAVEPSFFHGHGMFLVGRNAGGEFYANVIDDKCALYYTGNETFDDEGRVTDADIYYVREWGYTG